MDRLIKIIEISGSQTRMAALDSEGEIVAFLRKPPSMELETGSRFIDLLCVSRKDPAAVGKAYLAMADNATMPWEVDKERSGWGT